jgi:hypothetical protein
VALLGPVPRDRAPRGPRAAARIVATVCGLLWLTGSVEPAQTGPPKEYQVKAVFLFNFAQFVEWPTAAFENSHSPIIIGILGENPFGSYLDDTVRGETVEQRPLQVQRYRRVDQIKNCHILFISRSEASNLKEILMALKDRSILIVGDGDDFVQRGGMIRLATAQSRVRLIINTQAANAAMLTISSQLLRSADLVAPEKE